MGKPKASSLRRERADVEAALQKQANEGAGLIGAAGAVFDGYGNVSDLETLKDDFARWNGFNRELLRQCFTSENELQEYLGAGMPHFGPMLIDASTDLSAPSLEERQAVFLGELHAKTSTLNELVRRLPLMSVADAGVPSKQAAMVDENAARCQQRLGPVFIGHGRATTWRELQAFLERRLRLQVEEFNSVPVAGVSTKERLQELLNTCSFAFLVMTAEDVDSEGKATNARQNVIHEVGLFQGRHGFERAIVMLEHGCTEFSNIHGLGQIRFPNGNIGAVFQEVREVIERESVASRTSAHDGDPRRPDTEFVSSYGVLFKPGPDGAYEESAYCPQCYRAMAVVAEYVVCTSCNHATSVPGGLKRALAELAPPGRP